MKEYRIGYTTGVFDLFHIGHLNVLKNAKAKCRYLIVGVSTDECVRTYKNKTPIIPFEERKAIVEAIEYVDEVVPQETMDKFEAWERLGYDVLLHGDDWKGTPMYDRYIEQFKGTGVAIEFLPHTQGTSSTMITEVLNKVLSR